MSQTRWTLWELLVAVGWISAHLAMLRYAYVTVDTLSPLLQRWQWCSVLAAYFGAGAAMGAALGVFYRQQLRGALGGILLAIVGLIVLATG